MTFSSDQILNKHNQPIYHFVHQEGKSELDKCLNFFKGYPTVYTRYDGVLNEYTCLVTLTNVAVFDNSEDLIATYETTENLQTLTDINNSLQTYFDNEI